MHQNGFFPHTMRLITKGDERTVRPEGDSLRYAINCGLGLSFISEAEQRQILGGSSARDVILATAKRAETSDDPGAVALAAWTAAEAENIFTARLFERLTDLLASRQPVATVDCSWMLIAAVAARKLGDTYDLAVMAKERLMAAQGAYGLFPHRLPASSNGKLRAHIGCFADQVYSTQGLARFAVAYQDQAALVAADACGARICQLQGPDGQWWWHYDVRNGTVVEGYPVYSVHQHAMAPMALLDLREAGGVDHMGALVKGLQWLVRHPEVSEPMICEQDAVIWRKAARREPKKAVRALSAVTTALKPGLHLPGLDRAFPPNQVDHECRPYELGWLLYAWLSGGVVANS
ncbi:hypothetical protein [Neomesorhizobium albiziae]|nr:hypothetical protein [Mesorhizobium albiziae]GLS30388.1 hypothetical protein GCM10007937_20960 [Mesorhizobium albiziae]